MSFTKKKKGQHGKKEVSGGQTVLIIIMRTILHIILITLDLGGLRCEIQDRLNSTGPDNARANFDETAFYSKCKIILSGSRDVKENSPDKS